MSQQWNDLNSATKPRGTCVGLIFGPKIQSRVHLKSLLAHSASSGAPSPSPPEAVGSRLRKSQNGFCKEQFIDMLSALHRKNSGYTTSPFSLMSMVYFLCRHWPWSHSPNFHFITWLLSWGIANPPNQTMHTLKGNPPPCRLQSSTEELLMHQYRHAITPAATLISATLGLACLAPKSCGWWQSVKLKRRSRYFTTVLLLRDKL